MGGRRTVRALERGLPELARLLELRGGHAAAHAAHHRGLARWGGGCVYAHGP